MNIHTIAGIWDDVFSFAGVRGVWRSAIDFWTTTVERRWIAFTMTAFSSRSSMGRQTNAIRSRAAAG